MDERDERTGTRQPEPGRGSRRGGPLSLVVGLLLGLAGFLGLVGRRRPRLPGVDAADLAAGHETSDVSPRGIIAAAVVLAVILAVMLAAITALVASYTERPVSLSQLPGLSPLPTPQLPPQPRLQVEPGQELAQYRAQQEELLHSYGWVDQSNGVVHIPIDRAITLLAQRGLPSRPAAAAQQFRDHAEGSPSGSSSGRAEEPWP